MPISNPKDYKPGHFKNVYDYILKPAIENAGYEPYRVDQDLLSKDIMLKIIKGIQEFPMAICDLSSRNPNVLYELGLRQAYNLPVVLVKDDKTEDIFDVSGLMTHKYDSNLPYENVEKVKERITKAIKDTENSENECFTILQLLGSGKSDSNISDTLAEIEALSSEIKINYAVDDFGYVNVGYIQSKFKSLNNKIALNPSLNANAEVSEKLKKLLKEVIKYSNKKD